MNRNCYKVLGLMSGTSLDGLDIAYCIFEKNADKWNFSISAAETFTYDSRWQEKMAALHDITAEEMRALDISYGKWTGEMVNHFLEKNRLERPDFIGSHGHTVFHNPKESYTLQIGEGASIARITDCKVVSDFRTQDVVLEGQGAPLVPIGDAMLFDQWDACLNLGGFANISYQKNGARLAFDISPANIVLNPLAKKLGMEYDKGGDLARQGKILPAFLKALNAIAYYQDSAPKSLGVEWVKKTIDPIVSKEKASEKDLLRTLCEHIAMQIGNNLAGIDNVLLTGGGAWNSFLIERIRANCTTEVHIPEEKIVDYKESLIFAFLAVLRVRNEVNCLQTVTGASKDHSSGVIHCI